MYLTPEQAAAYLAVSADTVREWAREGTIPAHKFGRLWRFREEELKAGYSCPSTDTPNPRIGGADSQSAVERFANRQALKTASLPRNTNTSSEHDSGASPSSERRITPGLKPKSAGSTKRPANAP